MVATIGGTTLTLASYMAFPGAPFHEYVAYIDEAGDPGLNRVRPVDDVGGTEWMTLSACVVRRENVGKEPQWVSDILREIGINQRRDLHFTALSPSRKERVCRMVAELPLRCFVVASNKRNMRGHRNPRAEKVSSPQWFYNWLVRILIERITHFCEHDSIARYQETRCVKFEFSQRGGHSYSQTAAYHELIRVQARAENTVLKKWVPKWSVMHWKLVEAYPHEERAGLQLADVIASAFYAAVDNLDTGPCEPRYAKLLKPRIAFVKGCPAADYGVVLQPTPDWKAPITDDQREIFRHYGYEFTKKVVGPGPVSFPAVRPPQVVTVRE